MRDKNKLKKLLILFSTGAIILTPVIGVFASGIQKTNSNNNSDNENNSLDKILIQTDLGTFAYNATDQDILSRLLTLNNVESSAHTELTLNGNTVSGTIVVDGKTYSGSVDITYTTVDNISVIENDLISLVNDKNDSAWDLNDLQDKKLGGTSDNKDKTLSELGITVALATDDKLSGTNDVDKTETLTFTANGMSYSGSIDIEHNYTETTFVKDDISVIQDDLSNLLNKSSMTTTEWDIDNLKSHKLGGDSEYKDKTLSELGIDVEKTIHNSDTNTYDYVFSGSDDDLNDHPFSGSTSKITHLLSISTLEAKIKGTLNYKTIDWGTDNNGCKGLDSTPENWSRTLRCYGIVAELTSTDSNSGAQTWRFKVGTSDAVYKQDSNDNLVNDSDGISSGLLASDDYVEYVKNVESTTVDLSQNNTSTYQFLSDYVTMTGTNVDQQHLLQYVKKLDISTIQTAVDNKFGQGAITVSKGSTYDAESSSKGTRMITFTGTGKFVNGYKYVSSISSLEWSWDDNKEITVDEVNSLMKLKTSDDEPPKYVKTTNSDGNVYFENTEYVNKDVDGNNAYTYITLGNTDVHTVSAKKESGIRWYCAKTRNIKWVNQNLFDEDDWTNEKGTVKNNGSYYNGVYDIGTPNYFWTVNVRYSISLDFEGSYLSTFNLKDVSTNGTENYFFQTFICRLKFKIKISGYKEFYLNTNLTFNY